MLRRVPWFRLEIAKRQNSLHFHIAVFHGAGVMVALLRREPLMDRVDDSAIRTAERDGGSSRSLEVADRHS